MIFDPFRELDLAGWIEKSPDLAQRSFREAVHIVLTAIGSSSALRSRMVMKGGLLLAIRYDSTRFTRDADFSTRETYARQGQEEVLRELSTQIEVANDRHSYDTMCRLQSHRLKPPNDDARFPTLRLNIGYARRSVQSHLRKLRAGESSTVVQIDYSFNEAVYDVEVISIGDGEELQAYSLKNLIAEKFRALLQQPVRSRYRRQDIYDLYGLLTACAPLSEEEKKSIVRLLIDSCGARGIEATQTSMRNPQVKEMAARDYESLAAEIEGELPDFEQAYAYVQAFYEALPW